jgi:hypothetical protein
MLSQGVSVEQPAVRAVRGRWCNNQGHAGGSLANATSQASEGAVVRSSVRAAGVCVVPREVWGEAVTALRLP